MSKPQAPTLTTHGHGFGAGPVFLACTTTILGAIVFLRMGYAVGHTGLLGALAIIIIGHCVTIPTALAVSEIATNRRVEGGGEYFMISRSFGHSIGGTIGVSLFLSEAISIAFYMAAFSQSFTVFDWWFVDTFGFFDTRMIAIPATFLLGLLLVTQGASHGIKVLWVVTSVQFIALLFFFIGGTPEGIDPGPIEWLSDLEGRDAFMMVFAVCFTGFTGLTAGVGLSGDLKDPRKAIPKGILAGVLLSMVVYIFVVVKIAVSVPIEMAAGEQLIMAQIALWAPIVLIGLACSTLTSALGSILVAPRTLQALGKDEFSPWTSFNNFINKGVGIENEPRNATILATLIALLMVSLGSVNSIARIVSMFFMVTYGSLCLISFLEHFAARPAYRPSFKSRWYVSLFGATMCFLLMFLMDPMFASLAVVVLVVLYFVIKSRRSDNDDGVVALFEGVMAQATRYLQIKLQKNEPSDWRPSIIMISDKTFERNVPLQFMFWLSKRYGFGTYIHFIKGRLDNETYQIGEQKLNQLLADPVIKGSNLYIDTMVSPSMFSALAQTLQVPGVSGVENNTILFDFSIHDEPEVLKQILDGCNLASATGINRLVLRHGDNFFGSRRAIHIWLTWHDYKNASLMILLAYILLAHSDWEDAEISIFAAYPDSETDDRTAQLLTMVEEGRIPISPKNLEIIPTTDRSDFQQLVGERSANADLVIMGFTDARMNKLGEEIFQRHPKLRDVLFVNAQEDIFIES